MTLARPVATLRNALRLLRRRGFDTSTESGRNDERHQRALLNAGAAMVAKFASVAANLVVIPMVLNHLGSERFGVWATVTSFVMLLSFADMGIGNGLMTAVSQASGRGDKDELRRLATAGVLSTGALGLLMVAASIFICPLAPWARWLNVAGESAGEVAPAITVLGVCLGLSIPAGVATRIETGLQRGFVSSALQVAGAVLSLAATIVAVRLGAGLPWLVGAAVGAPALALAINSLVFFTWRRPDLRPARADFSRPTLASLLRIGLLFFALQLALALGAWTDNIIVSRLMGPVAVTQYAIPARLYGLISMLVILATGPLWPAYGEAMSRGDHAWARRTLTGTMKLSLLGAAGAAVALSFLVQPILDVWVGGRVQPSGLLIAGLGLAAVVESWRATVVMFLNGSAVVHLQLAVDLSFAVICIAIRIVLVSAIGLAGIPLGAVAAFVITTLIPYTRYLRRRFNTDLAIR